jgi:hypothetical protein
MFTAMSVSTFREPWTFSLPLRYTEVDKGHCRSSEIFRDHIGSAPYAAVAALCCCAILCWPSLVRTHDSQYHNIGHAATGDLMTDAYAGQQWRTGNGHRI